MIVLVYDPASYAVPDGEVERVLRSILAIHGKVGRVEREYSTANIFARVRLAVVRKEIDINECYVEFRYTDSNNVRHELEVNKYGSITAPWPRGFLDLEMDICEEILTLAMKMRKEERKL